MNLRNLINQLPFYFKEADTYKNSNGEGLLERYLQIFGKYLEDDLKPSIESMREYISVDVFNDNDGLNEMAGITQSLRGVFRCDYFWDFLGQMPYARLLKEPIRDIEAKSLDLASGNTYKPFISKFFTKYDIGPIKLTIADIYGLFNIIDKTPGTVEGSLIDTTHTNELFFALLVYSVPLYKIRGTEKFFRIYFEMLDLGIYVSSISDSTTIYHKDTLNDKAKVQVNGSDTEFYTKEVSDVKGLNDVITKLDQKDNLLDGCNLDAHPSCQKCKTVNVVMDDSKISAGTPDKFWALHSKVLSIFDRFLPINVKANITYSDKSNNWNKAYLVTDPIINFYIWDGKDWIISSNSNEWVKNNYIDINRKEVKVKVIITDTTIRGSHTKYHFEVLDNRYDATTNKSETIHDSGDIITITKSGTYYIRVCENKLNFGSGFPEIPVINSFTIRETSLVINPSITYKILDSNGSEVEGFSMPSAGGTTSYLYIRVYSYVNNEWANFTIENPDGTVENIMEYGDSDDEGRYYYDYYIESKGTYKISLISYPTIYTKVEVGMEDEYADCNLRYISSTLLKEGDSIPVAIRATILYLGKLNKIGLCSSSISSGYVSLHSSKYLDSLYADVDSNSSIYGITSKANIVGFSHHGYIHCYLKLDTSAWKGTQGRRYIQLKNVPYDDKNSFIGIYNPSTKALTKLPIKWRELRKVTTPYGTYNVKDSVPYSISGYLRNNNTNLLEILSTGVGWAMDYYNPNKYYMDGDIVYLDRVGEYDYYGAIPQLDERNEYYDNGGDYIEIDQNIVDIGPLNYILSPHGTFFYPTQESNGLPAPSDSIKFTLTCVTTLTWAKGRDYYKRGLIPINGILQQYRPQSDGQSKWIVGTDGNPNATTNPFKEEDTSYSTYTLKHTYTIKYGDYSTYPTRIKLGGLTEHYIDVHLGIFIDPNKNYIYLQPVDPLDGGWSKPNWGSADLSTPTNTPDRVEYDLMANKLEFTIQQTLIDNNNKSGGVNGGMAKLFTVTTKDGKEVETYTGQSYIIGTEVISNIKTTGKYRLRGEGDYSANYIEINVISSGTFKIACDPPVAALSAEGYATTRVTATCDTPNTPAYQLQVQRDGESVWHDVPYDFVANNLGVYHFIVRGNTTVGTTFSVVSKLTVSTNKSQLTWAADNTEVQEVELTADNNLQWSIEVSDD